MLRGRVHPIPTFHDRAPPNVLKWIDMSQDVGIHCQYLAWNSRHVFGDASTDIESVKKKIEDGCVHLVLNRCGDFGPEDIKAMRSFIESADGCRLRAIRFRGPDLDLSKVEMGKHIGGLFGVRDDVYLNSLAIAEVPTAPAPGVLAALLENAKLSGIRQSRLTGLALNKVAITTANLEELSDFLSDPECSLTDLSLGPMLTREESISETFPGSHACGLGTPRYYEEQQKHMVGFCTRTKAIARGIKANRSLRTLNLGLLPLDVESSAALVDAVCTNTSLLQLGLYPRKLDRELFLYGDLAAMILGTRSIRWFFFQQLDLGKEPPRHPTEGSAFAALMRAVEHCTVPELLVLDKAAARTSRAFVDVAVRNPRLKHFAVKHGCQYAVRSPLKARQDAMLARESRVVRLLSWRRAMEAHRDAALVFQAAAGGRPLELQKRLVVGELAGGADGRGMVDGREMDALEAAGAGGHALCVRMLERARAREANRQRIVAAEAVRAAESEAYRARIRQQNAMMKARAT